LADVTAVLERTYRDEWTTVVATVTRQVGGDIGLAEDAAQDAFTAAAAEWPTRGVPDRPGAWLTVTAKRRAIDRVRRDQARAARHERLAHEPTPDDDGDDLADAGHDASGVGDDRLRLIFTCCHPALNLEARLALTLKTVAGLDVPQVARAFLTSEATMYQRLTRAKRKIVAAGIPYRVPAGDQLAERLGGVLHVVYLIFNEGHTTTDGSELVDSGICAEAIRLARLLVELMPDDAEALGLLALLLLTDARRDARTDASGDPVGLDDQDRARWDAVAIAEGTALLDRALQLNRPGPYQVQAAIAALHGQAATFDATDWPQIAALYGSLEAMDPSPIVRLNRAVAVAHAAGPQQALAQLTPLLDDDRLGRYAALHAAHAEILHLAGDRAGAAHAWARAIELTDNARQGAAMTRRARAQAESAS
jgi:RNA polymerase sigma-70 factor (ECF subfamily)